MTIQLHATPEEVMRAVEALQEFARAKRTPEKAIFGLALALEECGSNIVNHALNKGSGQSFQVSFDRDGADFVIELRDHGPEFDPTRANGGEVPATDEEVPGGWGISLVRRYMDAITYKREGAENVLRLTKHLEPSANNKNNL